MTQEELLRAALTAVPLATSEVLNERLKPPQPQPPVAPTLPAGALMVAQPLPVTTPDMLPARCLSHAVWGVSTTTPAYRKKNLGRVVVTLGIDGMLLTTAAVLLLNGPRR